MTDDPEHESPTRDWPTRSRDCRRRSNRRRGVEDRLVASLRARGDIADAATPDAGLIAVGSWRSAAVLVATMLLRRPPGAAGDGAQFLLLIAEDTRYTPPADSSEARARVAEYGDWAGRLAGAGQARVGR